MLQSFFSFYFLLLFSSIIIAFWFPLQMRMILDWKRKPHDTNNGIEDRNKLHTIHFISCGRDWTWTFYMLSWAKRYIHVIFFRYITFFCFFHFFVDSCLDIFIRLLDGCQHAKFYIYVHLAISSALNILFSRNVYTMSLNSGKETKKLNSKCQRK